MFKTLRDAWSIAEIRKKLLREVDRLAKQPYGSAEASVIRNYLDGITLQDLLEQQTARAANDYVI